MSEYYVESHSRWFVALVKSKSAARALGVFEFGRGNVKEVRLATKDETKSYLAQKSLTKLNRED